MKHITYCFLIFIFLMITIFSFSACELFEEKNCDSQMEEVRQSRGNPEEVFTYDSSDYHSVDWWYWSQGICYTFTWGSIVGDCEISTYTFTPITSIQDKLMLLELHKQRREL